MIGDMGRGTVIAVWVTVILVILSLAVAFVGYETQGWFISKENQNIRGSIGYSQAANERCNADIQQYLDAKKANDAAHMQADYNDCKSATTGVPPANIDSNVAQFLATNGQ